MKSTFWALSLSLLVVIVLPSFLAAQAGQNTEAGHKKGDPIFVFHQDEFWLNLHHFLYVLARAENKEPDAARSAVVGAPADQAKGIASLTPAEQTAWRESVSAYAAGLAKKDLIFDDALSNVTRALAAAGDSKSLKGRQVDTAIASILERAAPIYRKAWWEGHRAANRAWEKMINEQLRTHGEEILAFITKAYQMKWPAAGFAVHLSAYAGWAGAYSVTGNMLVLSSLTDDAQGENGLETIFHEGMHQWDEAVAQVLNEAAKNSGKQVPRGLSHALIFYTAGEAVRRVIPGYIPYAEKFGVWQRGFTPLKAPIEEIWKPYLDGRGTRDQALAALVNRTGQAPKS